MKMANWFFIAAVLAFFLYVLGGGCYTKNKTPVVVITQPGFGTHNVTINYKLYDDGRGGLSRIEVEYSTDGETFNSATISPLAPEGTEKLRANKAGVSHVYLWDSLRDIGGDSDFETVYIRITPLDEDRGKAVTTDDFIVSNQQNSPPTASTKLNAVDTGDPDNWLDNWYIYEALNFGRDTDNGTVYWTCTVGRVSKSGDIKFYMNSAKRDIDLIAQSTVASDASNVYIIANGSSFYGSVYVNEDAFQFNYSVSGDLTDYFSNWQFGKTNYDTDTYDGKVDVTYTVYLIDNETAVDVFFWRFQPGTGYVGIAAGSAMVNDARLYFSGPYTLSGSVDLDNNIPEGTGAGTINFDIPTLEGELIVTALDIPEVPSIMGFFKEGTLTRGNIILAYYIADSDGDSVDVSVDYYVGSVGPIPCTEASGAGSDGTKMLTATALGIKHYFVWDSFKDLGADYHDDVMLIVTPMDSIGDGMCGQTQVFVVDNRAGGDLIYNDGTNRIFPRNYNTRFGVVTNLGGTGGDVICADRGSDLYYKNSGTANFTTLYLEPTYTHFPDTYGVAAADFNGADGVDAFFAGGGKNVVYIRDNDGSFEEPTYLSQGTGAYGVAIGNFADNETTYIFAANNGANYIWWYDSTAAEKWKYTHISGNVKSLARMSNFVAVGDLDNNGIDDAFVCNNGPNNIYLNPLDTDNNWIGGTDTLIDGLDNPNTTTYTAIIRDFDCDGWLDIIALGLGKPLYYRNEGLKAGLVPGDPDRKLPTFDLKEDWMPALDLKIHSVAVIDLDNDNDFDLILGVHGQNKLLINVNGHFFDCTKLNMPVISDATNCIITHDFNEDGVIEVMVLNNGPDKVYLQKTE
jgi:hypothetical protein